VLPAQVTRRLACLVLLQYPDDLFFAKTALHRLLLLLCFKGGYV
jgi:hypothetical protein